MNRRFKTDNCGIVGVVGSADDAKYDGIAFIDFVVHLTFLKYLYSKWLFARGIDYP